MHMRMDEFQLFQKNWDTQEKIKRFQLEREKEELKNSIGVNPTKGHKKNKSRILEKVRQEMIENSQMSSTSTLYNILNDGDSENDKTRELLEKQTKKYEKIMLQLEGDIRQHIRIEQQLKLHIEQMQQNSDDLQGHLNRKIQQMGKLKEHVQKTEK